MPRMYEEDGVWKKICPCCQIVKIPDEFGKHKTRIDGLSTKCKVCNRKNSDGSYMRVRPKYALIERDGKTFKLCPACNTEKEIDNFYATQGRPICRCKACTLEDQRAYNSTPEAKQIKKDYLERNKEIIRVKTNTIHARRREAHKDDLAWQEHIRETKRRSAAKHRITKNERQRQLRLSNPTRRLIHGQRVAIRQMICGEIKSGRSVELLQCSAEEFMRHIESQFTEGMNWANYGKGKDKWHVDHILCAELFDFSRPEHQIICFHHQNLRPMWSRDNIAKGDKLPDGRIARNLTPEQKLDYLASLGYGPYPTASTQNRDPAQNSPSALASSEDSATPSSQGPA